MTDNLNLRIWREIGRLQGQIEVLIEVLQEQIAELRRDRGPIIDHDPPPPARETDGNLICLPGVTLATMRSSRRRRRKLETTATERTS